MISAAQQNGVRLGVAYYRHHYPVVARLRDLVTSGELGQPVHAVAEAFERFDPPSDHPRAWLLKKALAGGGPMADVVPDNFLNRVRQCLRINRRGRFDYYGRSVQRRETSTLSLLAQTLGGNLGQR